MSFFDGLRKAFNFGTPAKGKWPRVVGNHELPPERIGIGDMLTLSGGTREIFTGDNVPAENRPGWTPWSPPKPPRDRNPLRDPDRDAFNDYLRDGSAEPPQRRGDR